MSTLRYRKYAPTAELYKTSTYYMYKEPGKGTLNLVKELDTEYTICMTLS